MQFSEIQAKKIKCHPAHVDYDFAKKQLLSDIAGYDVNFHLILSLSCKNDTKVFLKLLRFCFFVKCNDESVSNRLNCFSSYGFRNKNSSFYSWFRHHCFGMTYEILLQCWDVGVCAFFCQFLTRSYACRSGFVNNFFLLCFVQQIFEEFGQSSHADGRDCFVCMRVKEEREKKKKQKIRNNHCLLAPLNLNACQSLSVILSTHLPLIFVSDRTFPS